MNRKNRKDCTTLNYIEQVFILAATITGCISISTIASLIGIPIGVKSFAIGLKICTITAGIKKNKSIIKKKKETHDKIAILAKSKLNKLEVLISKAFNDSVISHDESALINNVRKEYNNMKKEIKNLVKKVLNSLSKILVYL